MSTDSAQKKIEERREDEDGRRKSRRKEKSVHMPRLDNIALFIHEQIQSILRETE